MRMRNSTVLYWYTTSRHVPWSSRDQQKTRHKVPSALFQSGSTLSMSFQIIIKSLATHPAHACYSILEPPNQNNDSSSQRRACNQWLPSRPTLSTPPSRTRRPSRRRSSCSLSSGTSFLGQPATITRTHYHANKITEEWTGPKRFRTPPTRSSPPPAAPLPAPSRRNPCCGA